MDSSGMSIVCPWHSGTDVASPARTSSMAYRSQRSLLVTLTLLCALATIPPAARAAGAETTDAILDSLQYGAFRYAWDQANPTTGLLRDRSQVGSPCSI